MYLSVLPPNPSLVAILLVVQTKSEPRVVFQYPPKPGEDSTRFQALLAKIAQQNESTSSSEQEGESSADEAQSTINEASELRKDQSPPEFDESGSVSPNKSASKSEDDAEMLLGNVFGYAEKVLAKLLCPSSASHKKKTEIGLDGKVFLGRPMYVESDGSWRRKSKARLLSSKSNIADSVPDLSDIVPVQDETVEDTETECSEIKGNTEQEENKTEDGGDEVALQQSSSGETIASADTQVQNESTKVEKTLNMFHVVFVLQPSPLEYHQRVKEMYDNIAKPFTKDLRYEQARSNYVGRQASIITSATKSLKASKGSNLGLKTLYKKLIGQSTLARAVATIYTNIAASQIAHIDLNGTIRTFQIPVPGSLTSLPSPLALQLPGLLLTTALSSISQIDSQDFFSHFGLLLLDDLKGILDDIKGVGQDYESLFSVYLRASKPTKSFIQVAQVTEIPIAAVQKLAWYLISSRRAQAIPPLNQRYIYAVSPNADMGNMTAASPIFARAFPALPTLTKFLGLLSSTPRPFSAVIPGKAHKEIYLEALAWLMRGGWVTHLRTFAWVRVPSHILHNNTREAAESDSSPAPESPRSAARHFTSTSASSSPPSNQSTASKNMLPSYARQSSIIIANPRLANAEQSRYLSAISHYVRDEQGDEVRAAWEKCVDYFDGKSTLESIAVSEGWKRKRTAGLITGWEELGIILKTRHW